MPRKVCLAGFSSLSREWANQQPDDVEVWGMNEAHKFLKRFTRWYQLHPRNWREHEKGHDRQKNCFGRGLEHVLFLQRSPVPVYMRQVFEDIPQSMPYPLQRVIDTFGYYITSSPSFMLAHAVLEHRDGQAIEEIRLAGIELALGNEYYHQRPNFEYLCGWARALGIKILTPPMGCSLLAAPMYSFDDPAVVPPPPGPGPGGLYFQPGDLVKTPVMTDGKGSLEGAVPVRVLVGPKPGEIRLSDDEDEAEVRAAGSSPGSKAG